MKYYKLMIQLKKANLYSLIKLFFMVKQCCNQIGLGLSDKITPLKIIMYINICVILTD